MMGLDFFRRSIELERELRQAGAADPEHDPDQRHPARRRVGRVPARTTSFLVGISIDGPREMHDAYRVDKGGKPTFDRVIARPGRAEAPRGRLERAHHRPRRQRRPRPRRSTPSCATSWARRSSSSSRSSSAPPSRPCRSPRRAGARRQGPAAVHPGREPGHPPVGRPGAVRPLPDRRVRGVGPPRHRRPSTSRCSTPRWPASTASPAACAFTPRPAASSSRWSTPATCTPATITSSPATCSATSASGTCWSSWSFPQQQQFGQAKRDTLTRYCLDCDVRFACNGGCPKDRFATSPYGEPGQHYLCPGYKEFFRHVSEPMRAMSRSCCAAGRPPSDLMATYAAPTPGAAGTTRAPAAAAASGSAAT